MRDIIERLETDINNLDTDNASLRARNAELENAVAAEREVCARIAQDHGEFCHTEAHNGGSADLHERGHGAIHIASKIRDRAALKAPS